MKYYAVLKRDELYSLKKTWWELKYILLSERSQLEKAPYSMIPIVWHKSKTVEAIKTSVDTREEGRDAKAGQRGFLGQWKYYAW